MGQKRAYSPRKSWLRERIVAELHLNGPVQDEKGRAMQLLAERVGHHSYMSVGNVIRQLEAEGNAFRVTAKDGQAPRDENGSPSPHHRRTYKVGLTDEFVATLSPIVEPESAEVEAVIAVEPAVGIVNEPAGAASVVEGDYEVPEDIDYDLVANAILGVVFKNLTASAEVQEVRVLRTELADAKAALTEAKQVIDALGEELKTERKFRGQVEDEAAALLAKVEELEFKAKGGGRNNGWDKVPVDGYKELRKIMQAVPTARG
jgi:hypothetical protein